MSKSDIVLKKPFKFVKHTFLYKDNYYTDSFGSWNEFSLTQIDNTKNSHSCDNFFMKLV